MCSFPVFISFSLDGTAGKMYSKTTGTTLFKDDGEQKKASRQTAAAAADGPAGSSDIQTRGGL